MCEKRKTTSMTLERKRELQRQYTAAIKGKTRDERRVEWHKFLAAFYKEDGNYEVFQALRNKARMNGAKLDKLLLARAITPKKFFRLLRRECADVYALALNECGMANIDIESPEYKQMTKEMAIQTLHAFKGVDSSNKSSVCVVMAKTWHHFVRLLHAQYGLPTVEQLRAKMHVESDAEESVLESNIFETTMTDEDRTEWETQVEAML